ncbi:hypothetical protein FM120_06870 [Sphingobacterium faecium PCAi_F2.5]|nr:hypothetical protein FM120_06870 [Sphingobacterium faecium PCAi_F2.5]
MFAEDPQFYLKNIPDWRYTLKLGQFPYGMKKTLKPRTLAHKASSFSST